MTFDRLSSDYSEELMNKALKLAEFYLEMSDDGKKKKQHK